MTQGTQSDDFHQQFMAQVRGQETPNSDSISAAPQSTSPKKKIEIRWLVIIFLVILLVATAIILGIVNANTISSEEEDMTPYNGNIIGLWGCADGTDMTFEADGTYIWENVTEAPVIETGTYKHQDNKLSITAQAYSIAGESAEFSKNTYDLRVYEGEDEYKIFFSKDNGLARSCIEVKYD